MRYAVQLLFVFMGLCCFYSGAAIAADTAGCATPVPKKYDMVCPGGGYQYDENGRMTGEVLNPPQSTITCTSCRCSCPSPIIDKNEPIICPMGTRVRCDQENKMKTEARKCWCEGQPFGMCGNECPGTKGGCGEPATDVYKFQCPNGGLEYDANGKRTGHWHEPTAEEVACTNCDCSCKYPQEDRAAAGEKLHCKPGQHIECDQNNEPKTKDRKCWCAGEPFEKCKDGC